MLAVVIITVFGDVSLVQMWNAKLAWRRNFTTVQFGALVLPALSHFMRLVSFLLVHCRGKLSTFASPHGAPGCDYFGRTCAQTFVTCR